MRRNKVLLITFEWQGSPPPLSTTGGDIPPCWQKKLKYFLYFTVISVKIDHFKHQNLKTLIFLSWGSAPRPLTPFQPPFQTFLAENLNGIR